MSFFEPAGAPAPGGSRSGGAGGGMPPRGGTERRRVDALIGELDAELAKTGIRGNPDPGKQPPAVTVRPAATAPACPTSPSASAVTLSP